FTIAKELCETRYVATGLGFMNMMNMLGIALVQPLVGFILDALWRGDIQHHVRVYPLQAYYIALGALPIAIIISLLLLPFVKETYGKHV
ncbi:MAG: MFS transporter, partial [Legionellaceae bacterium]|nr:MFS transporter [Legionellaceae bacterium]